MSTVATTKLSSKGQVVIPEAIREALGLEAGDQFIVVGDDEAIVLKRITAPSPAELRSLLAKIRAEARRVGLKRSDVHKAVKEVRRRG